MRLVTIERSALKCPFTRGRVLDPLSDLGGKNHPMSTAMRAHRGFLDLGGISNHPVGRHAIPDTDPSRNVVDADRGAV